MSLDKKSSISHMERKCNRKKCPGMSHEKQTKQRAITTEEKNIILKYKLEETDNENKYLLISGPLYLPKSSVDVTSLLLEKEKHISKTDQQFETDDNLEEEIMSYNFDELEKEDNFKRWKNRCDEGIFSIQDLLDVCEKDPDSILKVCRQSCTKDKHVPSQGTPDDYEKEPVSQIQLTHGAVFGDAKYHFLMVDAVTSITIMPKMNQENVIYSKFETIKSTDEVINFIDSDGSDLSEIAINPENNLNEESDLKSSETDIKKQKLKLSILSNKIIENVRKATNEEEVLKTHFIINEGNNKIKTTVKDTKLDTNTNTLEKMQKPTNEKRDTIGKDDDISVISQRSEKRESTVAWTGVESTHDSISSSSESELPRAASLEKVVLEATAKAESFRLNVNVKRQHSLLGDIIQQEKKRNRSVRKSTIEREDLDSVKTFKSAKCCGLIKGKQIATPDKSDGGSLKGEGKSNTQIMDAEDDYDADSSSGEDDERSSLDERMNSVGSVSSYKSRPTLIENPVYEKNVEMQKYLNNI